MADIQAERREWKRPRRRVFVITVTLRAAVKAGLVLAGIAAAYVFWRLM